MKTIILSLFAVLLTFVTFADAHYLYWMVDVGDENEDFYFNYATVSADGILLSNKTTGGVSAGTKIANNDEDGEALGPRTEAVYAYDVTPYLQSTFLFELYDDEKKLLLSRYVSAASLSDYIGDGMSTIASPFVIPEPTSGLLVLIGLAGLALRRRRGV